MRRASASERERLHHTFTALCAIESPSYREGDCAEWVTAQLRELGLEVFEDDAGARLGAQSGNRLATIGGVAGAGTGTMLLCAHLDTVPPTAPIEPVLVDGGYENAHSGILGADNKAAVAILIEVARRLTAGPEPPPVAVELLFTVCEEVSLAGSAAFDIGRLGSRFGFVFDHATPVGDVVIASPSHHRVIADFQGAAAHAGVRPEAGRSAIVAAARAVAAMRLGRLDPGTTANVGTITGGSALNVVPERCRLEAEVRSLDDARGQEVVTEMVDHLHDGANAAECDLDVTVERMFTGYRARASERPVALAERALRACGFEPRQIASGGASDANSFRAAGLPVVNLADGTERNHEPSERISLDALDGMFEVALALVQEAADDV